MKKIVLANWKANLSPERALAWCEEFTAGYRAREQWEVVIAAPCLFLERIAAKIGTVTGVSLAAQGVSPYPQGSYTGSVPAAWLRGLARYALLGHREQRLYLHQTVQDVARQVRESLAEDMEPIVCIDRPQLVQQAAAFAVEELERVIWAYTPETPVLLEMARDEQGIVAAVADVAARTERRPVLYGGGVTANNGRRIGSLPGIAGIMLGAGCLDARAFAALVGQL